MIELGKGAGSQQQQGAGTIDTSDATFMQDVVDASMQKPVVVLLWSRADPPSLSLAQELERQVAATRGALSLARLDVDRNPMVAGQLQVQTFPAVIAFYQGQGVTGFQGVPGPQQIKDFVEKLAGAAAQYAGQEGQEGPTLDDALDAADQMLEQGATQDALQTFAAVNAEDPKNARAIAGVVRALLALDKPREARQTLDNAPAEIAEDPAVKAARAQLELAETAPASGEEAGLRARLESDPDDHAARFGLANALIAQRRNEEAVDELLEIFRRDRDWNEGAAKERLITLIDSLGPKDPLAGKARRRLSSLMFS